MLKSLVLLSSIAFLTAFSIHSQTMKGFDLSNSSIPAGEIKDGGPPKDGIPSIDKPKFIGGDKTTLNDSDRVLGVKENGIAKAYPIKIMNYHEIVNDNFGDKPVVVTYCPLCGSGIAFDATVRGEPKTFGVSGLLYNSDVLLYDRETESLWSQLRYEAVAGPLAGEQLEILNTSNTTWKEWKNKNPGTLVLSENTGYKRNYDVDPYPGYESSSDIYFSVSEKDDRFHPKETVIGLEVNGKYKSYPFSELEKIKGNTLNDNFQGKKFRIIYNPEAKSAEILDAEGKPVPAVTNFWFAWYAFHPEMEVFEVAD
ncbi:DUF3179 domain-containing protein [Gillisia sp. JM1]|uniref:DUF3179 domain-containing protein n=1 Tax=Gillisia sp. JM1 TaxID=1283286 RepID=UPI000409189B|nr:DUF3179 domain-containing protein [Gillisia sp. JM1]